MPLREYRIPNFCGGRNSRDHRNVIGVNQSPADSDVEWEHYGTLKTRYGFRQYVMDQYGDYPVRALYPSVLNGVRHLIAVAGGKAYAYRGTGYPISDRLVLKAGIPEACEREVIQVSNRLYFSSYAAAGPPGLSGDVTTRPFNWKPGEGVLDSGIEAVDSDPINYTTTTPGGSMTLNGSASVVYFYRFANYFTDRGEGPYNVRGTQTTARGSHAGLGTLFQGVGVFPYQDTVASAGVGYITFSGITKATGADHVRIYRSTNGARTIGTRSYAGWLSNTELDQVPFYYIGQTSDGTYVDADPDEVLIQQAPVETQPLYGLHGYPLYSHCCVFGSRFFCGNVVTAKTMTAFETVTEVEVKPASLFYSDPFQPDRIMGEIEIYPTDEGGAITGLVEFENQLVIFKERKIYAMFGTGPADWTIRPVEIGFGCVAPRSIAVLGGSLIFLSSDGLYAYDGARPPVRVSDEIWPDLKTMNLSAQSLAAGGSWRGRYFLSLEVD